MKTAEEWVATHKGWDIVDVIREIQRDALEAAERCFSAQDPYKALRGLLPSKGKLVKSFKATPWSPTYPGPSGIRCHICGNDMARDPSGAFCLSPTCLPPKGKR